MRGEGAHPVFHTVNCFSTTYHLFNMSFPNKEIPGVIALFDVDGTLTPARLAIGDKLKALLPELRKKIVIGFVGGSDLAKQKEQLGEDVISQFDYCFSENGLTAYKLGKQLASQSFIGWIGDEKYNQLAKWILAYLSKLELPVRRGTFIEFRNGMINVSPVGRNASTEERNAYEVYDKKHKIRETMVAELKKEFSDLALTYSIGGQISFDVFPTGWDKTYALQHIADQHFKEIHFFGDKAYPGGNDWEIYSDDRTIGHAVKSPEDTYNILKELFFKEK